MTTAILFGAALVATPVLAETAGNKGPAEVPATRDAPFSLPGEFAPTPALKFDPSALGRGPIGLDPAAAVESMGTETLNRDGSTESKEASEGMRAVIESQVKGSETAAEQRVIIGEDDRVQITDASDYPSRVIGWLWSQGQDDSWSTCSAALIGPYTVLTAAHCVYQHDNGGWIKQLVFLPGLTDPESAPFGTYDWENINILKGYIDNYDGTNYGSAMPWDLAVVTLSEDAGNQIGWLGIAVDEVADWKANMIGYPADKPEGTMWSINCDVKAKDIGDQLFMFGCDAWPGNSGSSVWEDRNGDIYVRGIFVAYDETSNYGLRLTDSYYQFIIDNYK